MSDGLTFGLFLLGVVAIGFVVGFAFASLLFLRQATEEDASE